MGEGGAAPPAPPVVDVLLHDDKLQKALYLVACRTTGNVAEGEDLYQQMIVRAMESAAAPPVGDLPAVRRFFHNLLKGLAANWRRAARGRRRVAYDDSLPPSSRRGLPNPERALAERHEVEEREREIVEVRGELEGEPLPLAVWGLVEQGVGEAFEISKRLQCSIEEVYAARRRIADCARRVKARARAREEEPA